MITMKWIKLNWFTEILLRCLITWNKNYSVQYRIDFTKNRKDFYYRIINNNEKFSNNQSKAIAKAQGGGAK